MSCYYHPNRAHETQCSNCGKNLCRECVVYKKNGSSMCTTCIAQDAAKDSVHEMDQRLKEKERRIKSKDEVERKRKNIRLFLQLGLILACLFIIAFQVPRMFSLLKDEKPLRNGTYETDALTDECIRNLWKVSGLLQKGLRPGNDILCPASNKPYDIIVKDDDIIVRSPNPELYGLKDIRVSKLKPVPEIIK